MSKHLTFRRTTVVDRSAHEVFEFLVDYGRAHEWRAGVVESSALPSGPLRSGSILYEVSAVLGRRIVTESIVDTVEAPYRLTFSHLNGPFPLSGEYTLTEAADGTEVTYTLAVELRGRWTMFASYLERFGNRTIALSLANLRSMLTAGRLTPVG